MDNNDARVSIHAAEQGQVQQQQQGNEGLLHGLTHVLGLQANQQRSYTGSGLATAQHTAADYLQAVEQGRIAVQSQLNFNYTESDSVFDKARSRLSMHAMSPPSKTKQPAGQLQSPYSDDEATLRRHGRGRSLFDRFNPSTSPKSSPAAAQPAPRSADKASRSPTRTRSPPKQSSSVEIAFGRRWPERNTKKPGSKSSSSSKRASATDGADASAGATASPSSQGERLSAMDRIKRFISPSKRDRSASRERSQSAQCTPQRSSYDSTAAAAMAAAASPASTTSAAVATAALAQLRIPDLNTVSQSAQSPARSKHSQECDSPLLGHPLFKQQLLRHGDNSLLLEHSLSAPAGQIAAAADECERSPARTQHWQTQHLQLSQQRCSEEAALQQQQQQQLEPLTQQLLLGPGFPSELVQQPQADTGDRQKPCQHWRLQQQEEEQQKQQPQEPELLAASPVRHSRPSEDSVLGTPYHDCGSDSPGALHTPAGPRSTDPARNLLMASCPANFFTTRNGIGRSPATSASGIYESPAPPAVGAPGASSNSSVPVDSPGVASVYLTPSAEAATAEAEVSGRHHQGARESRDDACSDLSTCDSDLEQYAEQREVAGGAYEQPYGLPGSWEGDSVQADPHSSSTVVNWDSVAPGQCCSAASSPASSPRVPGMKPLTHLGTAGSTPPAAAETEQLPASQDLAQLPEELKSVSCSSTPIGPQQSASHVPCDNDGAAAAALPGVSSFGAIAAALADSRPLWPVGVESSLPALSPSAVSCASSALSREASSVELARKVMSAKEAVNAAVAGALEAIRQAKTPSGGSRAGSPYAGSPYAGSPNKEPSTGHKGWADAAPEPAGQPSSPAVTAMLAASPADSPAQLHAAVLHLPSPAQGSAGDMEHAQAAALASCPTEGFTEVVDAGVHQHAGIREVRVEHVPVQQQLPMLPGVDIRLLPSSSDDYPGTSGTHDSIILGLPPVSFAGTAGSRTELLLSGTSCRSSSLSQPVASEVQPGSSSSMLPAAEVSAWQADRTTLDLPEGVSSIESDSFSRAFSSLDGAQHVSGCGGAVAAAVGMPLAPGHVPGAAAAEAAEYVVTEAVGSESADAAPGGLSWPADRPSLELPCEGGSGALSSDGGSFAGLEQHGGSPRASLSPRHTAAAAVSTPEASRAGPGPALVLPELPSLPHSDGGQQQQQHLRHQLEGAGREQEHQAAQGSCSAENVAAAAAAELAARAVHTLLTAQLGRYLQGRPSHIDGPAPPAAGVGTRLPGNSGAADCRILDSIPEVDLYDQPQEQLPTERQLAEGVLKPLQQQEPHSLQQLAPDTQKLLLLPTEGPAEADAEEECATQHVLQHQLEHQQGLSMQCMEEPPEQAVLDHMWLETARVLGEPGSTDLEGQPASSLQDNGDEDIQQQQQQSPEDSHGCTEAAAAAAAAATGLLVPLAPQLLGQPWQQQQQDRCQHTQQQVTQDDELHAAGQEQQHQHQSVPLQTGRSSAEGAVEGPQGLEHAAAELQTAAHQPASSRSPRRDEPMQEALPFTDDVGGRPSSCPATPGGCGPYTAALLDSDFATALAARPASEADATYLAPTELAGVWEAAAMVQEGQNNWSDMDAGRVAAGAEARTIEGASQPAPAADVSLAAPGQEAAAASAASEGFLSTSHSAASPADTAAASPAAAEADDSWVAHGQQQLELLQPAGSDQTSVVPGPTAAECSGSSNSSSSSPSWPPASSNGAQHYEQQRPTAANSKSPVPSRELAASPETNRLESIFNNIFKLSDSMLAEAVHSLVGTSPRRGSRLQQAEGAAAAAGHQQAAEAINEPLMQSTAAADGGGGGGGAAAAVGTGAAVAATAREAGVDSTPVCMAGSNAAGDDADVMAIAEGAASRSRAVSSAQACLAEPGNRACSMAAGDAEATAAGDSSNAAMGVQDQTSLPAAAAAGATHAFAAHSSQSTAATAGETAAAHDAQHQQEPQGICSAAAVKSDSPCSGVAATVCQEAPSAAADVPPAAEVSCSFTDASSCSAAPHTEHSPLAVGDSWADCSSCDVVDAAAAAVGPAICEAVAAATTSDAANTGAAASTAAVLSGQEGSGLDSKFCADIGGADGLANTAAAEGSGAAGTGLLHTHPAAAAAGAGAAHASASAVQPTSSSGSRADEHAAAGTHSPAGHAAAETAAEQADHHWDSGKSVPPATAAGALVAPADSPSGIEALHPDEREGSALPVLRTASYVAALLGHAGKVDMVSPAADSLPAVALTTQALPAGTGAATAAAEEQGEVPHATVDQTVDGGTAAGAATLRAGRSCPVQADEQEGGTESGTTAAAVCAAAAAAAHAARLTLSVDVPPSEPAARQQSEAKQPRSYAAAAAAAAGAQTGGSCASSLTQSPGSSIRQHHGPPVRKDKALVPQHSHTGGLEEPGSPWAIKTATMQAGQQSAATSAAGSSGGGSRYSSAGVSSAGSSSAAADRPGSTGGLFESGSGMQAAPGSTSFLLTSARASPSARVTAAMGVGGADSASGQGTSSTSAHDLLYGRFSSEGGDWTCTRAAVAAAAVVAAPPPAAPAVPDPSTTDVTGEQGLAEDSAELLVDDMCRGAAAAASSTSLLAAGLTNEPFAGCLDVAAPVSIEDAPESSRSAGMAAATLFADTLAAAASSNVVDPGSSADSTSSRLDSPATCGVTAAGTAVAAAAAAANDSRPIKRKKKQKRKAAAQVHAQEAATTAPCAATEATTAVKAGSRRRDQRATTGPGWWQAAAAVLLLVLAGGALMCLRPGSVGCSSLWQQPYAGMPSMQESWRSCSMTAASSVAAASSKAAQLLQQAQGALGAGQLWQRAQGALATSTTATAAKSRQWWQRVQADAQQRTAAVAATSRQWMQGTEDLLVNSAIALQHHPWVQQAKAATASTASTIQQWQPWQHLQGLHHKVQHSSGWGLSAWQKQEQQEGSPPKAATAAGQQQVTLQLQQERQQEQWRAAHDQQEAEAMRQTLHELESRVQRLQTRSTASGPDTEAGLLHDAVHGDAAESEVLAAALKQGEQHVADVVGVQPHSAKTHHQSQPVADKQPAKPAAPPTPADISRHDDPAAAGDAAASAEPSLAAPSAVVEHAGSVGTGADAATIIEQQQEVLLESDWLPFPPEQQRSGQQQELQGDGRDQEQREARLQKGVLGAGTVLYEPLPTWPLEDDDITAAEQGQLLRPQQQLDQADGEGDTAPYEAIVHDYDDYVDLNEQLRQLEQMRPAPQPLEPHAPTADSGSEQPPTPAAFPAGLGGGLIALGHGDQEPSEDLSQLYEPLVHSYYEYYADIHPLTPRVQHQDLDLYADMHPPAPQEQQQHPHDWPGNAADGPEQAKGDHREVEDLADAKQEVLLQQHDQQQQHLEALAPDSLSGAAAAAEQDAAASTLTQLLAALNADVHEGSEGRLDENEAAVISAAGVAPEAAGHSRTADAGLGATASSDGHVDELEATPASGSAAGVASEAAAPLQTVAGREAAAADSSTATVAAGLEPAATTAEADQQLHGPSQPRVASGAELGDVHAAEQQAEATEPSAAGSQPARPAYFRLVAAVAAVAGLVLCAASLGTLLLSAQQAAVVALGPQTPETQLRTLSDLDYSDGGDGIGWGGEEADSYRHDAEIQPYGAADALGFGAAGWGLDPDHDVSDDSDASFALSNASDVADDDSQYSYDVSEEPFDDNNDDEAQGGPEPRGSSRFAGFVPFGSAAAPAAPTSGAAAQPSAPGVAAARGSRYALRPRDGLDAGATDFWWLRPNKFLPRRSQGNMPADGGAGSSSITQRWLRNRVITRIDGSAAQNPEVVDLVNSSAAVAYSSPPQQRRLSAGGMLPSPEQQQQQQHERRLSSGVRAERGQSGGGASPGPSRAAGRLMPGLQLTAVAGGNGGRGHNSGPGRARGENRSDGGAGLNPKSPRGLRDDRTDVVLGD